MKLKSKHIFLSILTILVLIEVGLRTSGIIDFPLYDANSIIGYIPKPSQNGSFLNKNDWQFNSLSMGSSEFKPTNAIDTLLIGDSVVLGGNPYRQEDRLAPQLQLETKLPIWPISAGSWGLRNELIYLKLHPEVVKSVDRFIFVLNSGDFDKASSWSCEITHPRSYPILAVAYVLKKYVYNWESCGDSPQELVVTPGDWKVELQEFLSTNDVKDKPIYIFLYPDKNEVSENSIKYHLEIYGTDILKLQPTVKVFSVGKDSRWNIEFYRDSIHPSVAGTKALASIINSPHQNSKLE